MIYIYIIFAIISLLLIINVTEKKKFVRRFNKLRDK